MANENVTFSKGISSELPSQKQGGQFLVETDTGNMYLDVDDTTRIKVSNNQVAVQTTEPTNPATNLWISLDGGTSNSLPPVTSDDNGDILQVQQGSWTKSGSLTSLEKTVTSSQTLLESTVSDVQSLKESYIPKSGGTFTGAVNVQQPVSGSNPATKLYVDNQISSNVYTTGNVYITSTNSPPTSDGNWQLIDKEFTPATSQNLPSPNSIIKINDTNVASYSTSLTRSGHSIYIRLNFTSSVVLDDSSIELGTLRLSALGISSIKYPINITGYTDGGNAILMGQITTQGQITNNDIIGKSDAVSSGMSLLYATTLVVNYEDMLDSSCNKFFWKRT